MKLPVFWIAVCILSPLICLGVVSHFWRGETLSVSGVCKKWPGVDFKPELFQKGDQKIRASMACSLVKKQSRYLGKDRSEVRKDLGNFDGFYFSDMFPTYMIERGKSRSEDSWQIVFLLDRHEKIAEVVVHKNCCD